MTQKLSIAKTIHGYFLAPKHIPSRKDESDSETEEETDDDEYNIEFDDHSASSSGSEQFSLSRTRLKRTTGNTSSFINVVL